MQSPGTEGPPGTDEHAGGDPDTGGGRNNTKSKKRPAEETNDNKGPQKKKPRKRTKIPTKKNDKDDDDGDTGHKTDTGSEQTTYRTGTTTSPSDSSQKNSDDDDLDCGKPGDKAYFTFILHYSNMSDTWKTAVAGRKKGCPSFISFDHGDHIHVLFGSSGGGGNSTRTRGRITRFLSTNSAGIAESIITMQRVKHLRKFLLYCIRYGVEGTHVYGSPRHPDLAEILETLKQLFKDRDPNEVIQMAGCEPYAEHKKDTKTKRIGSTKSKHLAKADELQESHTHVSRKKTNQYFSNVEAGQLSDNAVDMDGPRDDEGFVAHYHQPSRDEDSNTTEEVCYFRDIGKTTPFQPVPPRPHTHERGRSSEEESLVPSGPGAPILPTIRLPGAPFTFGQLPVPLFNEHIFPTYTPHPHGPGTGDPGTGPPPADDNLDPDLQRHVSDDSIPDQDDGGGPDGDNHGADEVGDDTDPRKRDDPALDDGGHRDTDAPPMQSPGREGPPGTDEPANGDPDT
jgi:hypothetical protein